MPPAERRDYWLTGWLSMERVNVNTPNNKIVVLRVTPIFFSEAGKKSDPMHAML
jgi:hypothetical protein